MARIAIKYLLIFRTESGGGLQEHLQAYFEIFPWSTWCSTTTTLYRHSMLPCCLDKLGSFNPQVSPSLHLRPLPNIREVGVHQEIRQLVFDLESSVVIDTRVLATEHDGFLSSLRSMQRLTIHFNDPGLDETMNRCDGFDMLNVAAYHPWTSNLTNKNSTA